MMFILFFVASLVLLLVALWRFPFGSFQNIICLFLAAAFMYASMSMYVIGSATPTTTNYLPENIINGNTLVQYPSYNTTAYNPVSSQTALVGWSMTVPYCFVCIIFALIGLLYRASGRLK
jgi:hypothetical protein